MNVTQRPQRAFLTVTLITVLAVTMVFMVYAALLATYTGNVVQVQEPGGGSIEYNLESNNNSTWTTSFGTSISNGTSWWARLNITDPAPQTVTVQWILVKNSVEGVNPLNSTVTLQSGVTNTIYVTLDGKYSGNYDWRSDTLTGGDYQVRAKIYG